MYIIYENNNISIDKKFNIKYKDKIIILYQNDYLHKHISIEELDNMVEKEKKIILFTNSVYLENNREIFNKYTNNLLFKLKSKHIILIEIIYYHNSYCNNIYISKQKIIYDKKDTVLDDISKLYNKLNNVRKTNKKFYKKYYKKYKNKILKTKNSKLIENYKDIINIIDKAFNKFKYDCIIIDIYSEIKEIEHEIEIIYKKEIENKEINQKIKKTIKKLIEEYTKESKEFKSLHIREYYNNIINYLIKNNNNDTYIKLDCQLVYINNILKKIEKKKITKYMKNKLIDQKNKLIMNKSSYIYEIKDIDLEKLETKEEYYKINNIFNKIKSI